MGLKWEGKPGLNSLPLSGRRSVPEMGKRHSILPDLAGRFAQGSMTPGQKIEAGLPNITGTINNPSPADTAFTFGGEWPIAGTSIRGL